MDERRGEERVVGGGGGSEVRESVCVRCFGG